MDFWVSCALLSASILGIVLLSRRMNGKEKKARYITGVVILAVLAFAFACYAALALVLLGGIR